MSDTTANRGYHYPLQKDNPLESRRFLDEIDADFNSLLPSSISASDIASINTTLANLSEMSRTVEASKKYYFEIVLSVRDSNMEGLKLGFQGGSMTDASFWATMRAYDSGFIKAQTIRSLSDIFAVDSFSDPSGGANGDGLVEVKGRFEVNAGGTFIPQIAQNSHSSGILTTYKGSALTLYPEAL